jgi:long-chain fatty acid transport protein
MKSYRNIVVLSCFAIAVLVPAPSVAQSSLQAPIQFDFLNPGARSLALGSAFVALADDATAALVNPAGLPQLARPEISVEGRFKRQTQPFLVSGRLSGAVTRQGVDTVSGPQFEDIVDSGGDLGFVSFVYAAKSVTFAAYRHSLISSEQTFSSTGVFQSRGFENRDTGFTGTRSLKIANYGGSVGVRITPTVSVGGGLSYYKSDLQFVFDRYSFPSFYAAPDPRLNLLHFTQSGNNGGLGGNIGILIAPSNKVKVGASFKKGGKFDFSAFSGGLVGTQKTTTGQFKIPDVFAVGAVVRPSDAFTLTVEFDRVQNSQLIKDYVNVLTGQGDSASRASNFSIADSNQFHLGAEYAFTSMKVTPSLRAGVWSDPDHSIHYAPTAANDFLDERLSVALSSGKDLWHYTFGAGVPVNTHLEFNVGGDVTSRSRVISTSAIVRF